MSKVFNRESQGAVMDWSSFETTLIGDFIVYHMIN